MFENIKLAAFDLDGTVYYGSKIIDGAADVIEKFRSRGTRVMFVTNNSVGCREKIHSKLVNMGLDCAKEDIMSAGYAAACFAKENDFKNLYVAGTDMLKQEFDELGVSYIEDTKSAEHLILGFDTRLTYDKMALAVEAGLSAKHIYTCNVDRLYPGENQRLLPGCGAITAAVEWCCNKKVELMIGKPGTYMLDLLCKTYGLKDNEILMIGDTYESDIVMANAKGCPSVLIGDKKDGTVCVERIADMLDFI